MGEPSSAGEAAGDLGGLSPKLPEPGRTKSEDTAAAPENHERTITEQ